MITIEAEVSLRQRTWAIAQIAAELEIDPQNFRKRYITRLVNNGHKHFRNYQGGPLTDTQKSVVIEFRRLSKDVGLRGDNLWAAILQFPRAPSYRRIAVAEICDRYNVASDKVEDMTQEIMELFDETESFSQRTGNPAGWAD